MRSANFRSKMAYVNYFSHLLVIQSTRDTEFGGFDAHMKFYKNNIFGSKGSRDLLFKFWNPLRNFWKGEGRHFVFSLLFYYT